MNSPDYHYKVWKILKGDKSDNIPSIVGPKKAEEIASDPQKLASFLESEENRANFNLNKELIELKIIHINDLLFKEYEINFEKVKEHFTAMDFNSMIEEKYWNNFVKTFSF
jgi:5'-3' exonuclease